jgi:hypothetical protein
MLLANAPEVLQNHHLTMLQRPQLPPWYVTDAAELETAVRDILRVFLDRGHDFLADYSTPAGILRQYEAKDTRALPQQHYHVHIIAACLLEGQPHRAMDILQHHFSPPALRKRYDALWKNVTARQPAN